MTRGIKMVYVLRQLISFLLPILVTIIIPWFLLEGNLRIPAFLHPTVLTGILFVAGLLLILVGLSLLVMTIRSFILIGRGTLAPWDPTKKLVVSGPYAYVRNPMISGVIAILLGESLLFLSWKVFAWFVLAFFINDLYFRLSEEPGLLARFGKEYREYKRNVPRWIPRLKPWKPAHKDEADTK